MKNLVELKSVGCHVDFAEKLVYPTLKNGLPDLDCPTDLYCEGSEEWWNSLSPNDTLSILERLNQIK